MTAMRRDALLSSFAVPIVLISIPPDYLLKGLTKKLLVVNIFWIYRKTGNVSSILMDKIAIYSGFTDLIARIST
jgi:hypothetical protein